MPDLFFRVGGTEAADCETLAGSLTNYQVQADMEDMIGMLRAAGATSVGMVGFCLGGSISYQMPTQTERFAAAIGFYGFGHDRPQRRPPPEDDRLPERGARLHARPEPGL